MAISTTRNREVHLVSRPQGEPAEDNFEVVEADVAPLQDGEVLVRNEFISVDPYMRGRMNDVKSYVPPFELHSCMDGGAVGTVVESRSPELAVGDSALHSLGWREYASGPASAFRRIDPSAAPLQSHLNALGMIGLTAWVGLVDIAAMREGDRVFVSGAAGAVGSLAGQIARLRGAARVVGSAGSDAKVRWLVDELGFDAAFNYRNGPVRRQLRDAAPDGIDVHFDNVGGEHLDAALGSMRLYGRAAICGAIALYNSTEPPTMRNWTMVIGKRLTLRGFLVFDHNERYGDFLREVGPWMADGRIRAQETVVDGIENAPSAFIGMLRGDNTGKMLVRIGGDR